MIALTSRSLRIAARRSPRAAADVLARVRSFFARAWAFLRKLAQAFAEGREMAHAARQRHPFAEW